MSDYEYGGSEERLVDEYDEFSDEDRLSDEYGEYEGSDRSSKSLSSGDLSEGSFSDGFLSDDEGKAKTGFKDLERAAISGTLCEQLIHTKRGLTDDQRKLRDVCSLLLDQYEGSGIDTNTVIKNIQEYVHEARMYNPLMLVLSEHYWAKHKSLKPVDFDEFLSEREVSSKSTEFQEADLLRSIRWLGIHKGKINV